MKTENVFLRRIFEPFSLQKLNQFMKNTLHLSPFFLIKHIKAINNLEINTRPPACLQSIKSVQTF